MARISYDNQAKQNVRYLIDFAQKKLYLDENDSLYAENALLDILGLTEPHEGEIKSYEIYGVLSALCDYAVRKKIIEEHQRLLFEARLMGAVMPPPSKVIEMFDATAHYEGVQSA